MITFRAEDGTTVRLESLLSLRWYARKGSSEWINRRTGLAYALLMKGDLVWHLRGREAERFIEWVEQLTAALPTHCCHCGAYLQGGLTDHKADCPILALIREVYREAKPEKAAAPSVRQFKTAGAS
jgi:cytochrome b